ncbi:MULTISPECIES: DISARM system phospholipase D-like protein DrmC [unclassified Pseudomonas]|uniref:DISARM system phospholipase D-like protein DrmC n=1 Tax=unclassified Pseudomonas TaxID=196821 RepID=UPI000C8874B5|nr:MULTISPECIES: DISARM system phospholipase D-like protein DrmC [unclassified Pseudomonas]PMZ72464.1 phospholipase [Pseudomonas sp. GW247-3R2A]PMY73092.1 phospholipase [Pseudomonas sp. MPR-R3A]PMY97949.1 phospholipase [Pseudomonas sp. FW305-124]PNA91774.1 phospholipase [Pseudomonas sp. FW300-E2]PNB02865.1 phospholipase [Pseudomonas sp. MPR-AND1B]
MRNLLAAISELVSIVSSDRVAALAAKVRGVDAAKAGDLGAGVLSAKAGNALKGLVDAWKASAASGETLAAMLLAAAHAFRHAESLQKVELVWTGPTTELVPARRTEQALIQVINAAKHRLFITSYVAYDIESIAKALRSAAERGVKIEFLMELSSAQGGKVSIDPIGNLRNIVPDAWFYIWKDKDAAFVNGSVHAKVAVADGLFCFITSANLTGYAMDQNMEAGVLISGVPLPEQLHRHLEALVITGVIVPIG